jgi:hypothetical protein
MCRVAIDTEMMKGITPTSAKISAGIVLVGFAWSIFTEWLRHRSWKKHKDSGFAPSTQHLAWWGTLGLLLCCVASILVLFFA